MYEMFDPITRNFKEISDDECICQICGKVTPNDLDEGGCEVVYGWMCNRCIAKLTCEGEPLEFIHSNID